MKKFKRVRIYKSNFRIDRYVTIYEEITNKKKIKPFQIQTKKEAIQRLNEGWDYDKKTFYKFRMDVCIAKLAIKSKELNITNLSKLFQSKSKFIKEIAHEGYYVLSALSKQTRDNKEIVCHYVKMAGYTLKFASDRLKDDEYVVILAVTDYGHAFSHASYRLKNNKEFVLQALKAMENTFGEPSLEEKLDMLPIEIAEICRGQDPIEALTKAIESEKLHAELQQELSLPTQSPSIPRKLKKL